MIDFKFIEALEGNVTKAYVPDPEQSKSGVTIGCGFDIGARSCEDLKKELPDEIAEKLVPYAGLKKQAAVTALQETPLHLTAEEVTALNECSMQTAIKRLTHLWQNSDPYMAFEQLPSQCQTVIASVSFQYGNLATRTPNFWRQVTQGDWQAALNNLRNFGDKYPTRRNKEAALLAEIV